MFRLWTISSIHLMAVRKCWNFALIRRTSWPKVNKPIYLRIKCYERVQKRIPLFKICIWQSQSRLVFWPAHRKHPISLKKTKAKHTDLSNGPCFLYTLYILNIIWEHSDDDSRMQWIINESFAFFLMKRHDASHKTNVNWQDALERCCCPTIKVIYTVYIVLIIIIICDQDQWTLLDW